MCCYLMLLKGAIVRDLDKLMSNHVSEAEEEAEGTALIDLKLKF